MDLAQPELAAGGFAPAVAVESAKQVTLGRKNANDADKSNYFEGTDD